MIDDESRVCGYIVASDYDSNTSYFRPMDLAFQNIRNVLRAGTVCLPDFKAPRMQSNKTDSQAEEASLLVANNALKTEVEKTGERLGTADALRTL